MSVSNPRCQFLTKGSHCLHGEQQVSKKKNTKEIDLTLGYTTGGFSISVTDYWFNGGPGYFHYGSHNTNHTFEAQIGYDFGPLALNWYTNFAGTDGVNNEGDRAYSS